MKLVVFDCDGTLVDSQHMIVAAMEGAFSRFGLRSPERTAILSVVGLSLDQAFQRLAPLAKSADVIALAEAYKTAFGQLRRDRAHEEPLYPGVRKALQALAREPDVLLGVATGKSRRGLAAVLDREGLTDLFVTLQTADTNPSKPHPAMLIEAMAQAGVKPHRTLMVGDTIYDVSMARDAGVRAIGVAWGYHPTAELAAAGAYCVMQDSLELADGLKLALQELNS